MSEEKKAATGIAILIAIILSSASLGHIVATKKMQRAAIEANAGGFDPKTGDFVFYDRFEN